MKRKDVLCLFSVCQSNPSKTLPWAEDCGQYDHHDHLLRMRKQ